MYITLPYNPSMHRSAWNLVRARRWACGMLFRPWSVHRVAPWVEKLQNWPTFDYSEAPWTHPLIDRGQIWRVRVNVWRALQRQISAWFDGIHCRP